MQHISDLHYKFALTPCVEVWYTSNLRLLRLGEEEKEELECGPMPNVMAALPNIGGVLCSMRKVWLTPTAEVYHAAMLPRRETR